MSARFIALPVAQGDSFYLEQPDFSVLVDGGRNRLAISQLFRHATRRSGVDILICTHNDADHANGVLGFLESGLACGEVWLPGRWLQGLEAVLQDPRTLAERLEIEVSGERLELGKFDHDSPRSILEQYEDQLSRASRPTSREDKQNDIVKRLGPPEAVAFPDSVTHLLERAQSWDSIYYDAHSFFDRHLWFDLHGGRLFIEALDAASRIRSIALAAFHRGIRIQWFEYEPNCFHRRPHLYCLNAKPAVCPVNQSPTRLLAWLALTTANRESLVFYAPGRKNGIASASHPGVLFTADSDLQSCASVALNDGTIVTAPHHGSESNAKAYGFVQKNMPSGQPVWVRSDGRYSSRPGSSYRGASGMRYCTMCNIGTRGWSSKKAVQFHAHGASWQPPCSQATCAC